MLPVFLLLLCPGIQSLRILSVLPSPTKSHYSPGRQIILELLRQNHEVVSISPFEEQPMKNYTWIEVETKSMFQAVPSLKEKCGQDYSFFGYQRYVWTAMNTYVEHITKKPKFANFLRNDTSHFDVIFMHEFFMPIFYVFTIKYNAPLVVISTFGYAHYIHRYMGAHFDFSTPHEFSNVKFPLDFYDWIKNMFYITYDIVGRKFYLLNYQNSLASDVFGLPNMPHLESFERNITAVLINTHFTTTIARERFPNVVEVGGVHIENVKPLNKELQEILDKAEYGAILFSFGSFIELESQKDEFISDVIKVLSNLKERVIIKWKADKNILSYPNIYAFPWLPQNDVLAHPNIKLFINHGGLLSNHESIYHGVPIICIPFQATQPLVCQTSAKLGYAIHIPKDEFNAKIFNESIHRVINDRSFKEQALEISRRFKDRPISALNLSVFWIEYTARHRVFRQVENAVCLWQITCLSLLVILYSIARFRKKNILPKEKES